MLEKVEETKQEAKQSQAVLVFKDSLIVSGINTLTKKIHQLNIPLITSDQESETYRSHLTINV